MAKIIFLDCNVIGKMMRNFEYQMVKLCQSSMVICPLTVLQMMIGTYGQSCSFENGLWYVSKEGGVTQILANYV